MRLLILFSFFSIANQIIAQNHDYHFMHSELGDEFSGIHIWYVDSIQDIRMERVDKMKKNLMTPTISDVEGNFLGYFNSLALFDSIGRIAVNGDEMEVGWSQAYMDEINENSGLAAEGSSKFIPITDSLFYLFHSTTEFLSGHDSFSIDFHEDGWGVPCYSTGIYLSKVRLRSDGRMEVKEEEKKIPILIDTLICGMLSFCKHANGRDWWMLYPRLLSEDMHLFLIEENGNIISQGTYPFSQNNMRVYQNGSLNFSLDGSIMARHVHRTTLEDHLEIFRFNRHSGRITDTLLITSIPIHEHAGTVCDLEFSENNRFLYLSYWDHILQFDLDDDLSLEYADTVAKWDGFYYYSIEVGMNEMILLPNGKIMVNDFSSTPYIHFIHEPNKKGTDCNFEHRVVELPIDPLNYPLNVTMRGLPNLPKYRMPALPTSTQEFIKTEADILIYPNPIDNGRFRIKSDKENLHYGIYDIDAKLLQEGQTYPDEIIDISHLSNGTYYLVINGHYATVLKLD